MRNASIEDVARAKATGKLEENVMYNWLGTKVHGKKLHQTLQFKIDSGATCQQVLVETDDGIVVAASLKNISAITKGPAQQPKKPRCKPRKGTRPETKIRMSADVKLEVGDMVLLTYKYKNSNVRGKVIDEAYGSPLIEFKFLHDDHKTHQIYFDKFEGKRQDNLRMGYTITHKIIPYQEPVKEEKSPEQEAFEAGYWVPFVATATSVCPKWAKDVPTTIKTRDGGESLLDGVICGDVWEWDNAQEEGTIVAYRKAKQ